MPGAGDRSQGVAGAVGTVTEDLEGLGAVEGLVCGEQPDARRAVGGLAPGFGELAPGGVIPDWGSITRWALKPSWRRSTVLCACRVSGSTTEMTGSFATRPRIRHFPPVPSEPSTGSTSRPAISASRRPSRRLGRPAPNRPGPPALPARRYEGVDQHSPCLGVVPGDLRFAWVVVVMSRTDLGDHVGCRGPRGGRCG
jgi:hypothetical protein